MRISDWSSDVCSSDLAVQAALDGEAAERSRLAKDLHDGLGSMLSVVKFNLPPMKSGAILEATDVSRFQKALGMLDDSIQELRREIGRASCRERVSQYV